MKQKMCLMMCLTRRLSHICAISKGVDRSSDASARKQEGQDL